MCDKRDSGGMERMQSPDRKLRLEYIHPDNLGKVWPILREGVEKIRRRCGDSWLVEDMYLAIKQNHSTLHIGYIDGQYRGFLVLTPTVSFDGPVLHIWGLYSNGGDGLDLLYDGIEHIKQFASKMNAKRITFHSPRKGWEKYGEKLGFKLRTQTFALETENA